MATLNGRVLFVGATTVFNSDQLADNGLTGNERLLVVLVNDDDPGNVPWALAWAEQVRITIEDTKP